MYLNTRFLVIMKPCFPDFWNNICKLTSFISILKSPTLLSPHLKTCSEWEMMLIHTVSTAVLLSQDYLHDSIVIACFNSISLLWELILDVILCCCMLNWGDNNNNNNNINDNSFILGGGLVYLKLNFHEALKHYNIQM